MRLLTAPYRAAAGSSPAGPRPGSYIKRTGVELCREPGEDVKIGLISVATELIICIPRALLYSMGFYWGRYCSIAVV
jgi:hypothetical protein